jgi:hypothetical protein
VRSHLRQRVLTATEADFQPQRTGRQQRRQRQPR